MNRDMTTGHDWKVILIFTLPIMAGNLLQQLYTVVDGIIVGNFVGEHALSATGTCIPLVILFLSFAIGMSVGGGILISQYFGARRTDDLHVASSTIIIMMGALGLLMTVLGLIVSKPILEHVMNTPEENDILNLAVQYFQIYCLGIFFQFVYNAISSMLRNIGNSKAMLYFLAVSAVLNTALDLLFVAVFDFGVAGAAAATTISQAVCAVVSYIYMIKKAPILCPKRESGLFDKNMCKMTLRLGLPAAIQQSILSCGHVVMQRLVNSFGSASMSAYTTAGMVEQFALIPLFSFNAGISTFTGQNIGAGKIERAKKGMLRTHIMSMAASAAAIFVLLLFTEEIVGLFGLGGDALSRSMEEIHYIAPWYLLCSVYFIIGGFLQGAGDVLCPMIATITALVSRVVFGYVSVHIGLFSYDAPWAVVPATWLLGLIINLTRYLSGAWKGKSVSDRSQENIETPQ